MNAMWNGKKYLINSERGKKWEKKKYVKGVTNRKQILGLVDLNPQIWYVH